MFRNGAIYNNNQSIGNEIKHRKLGFPFNKISLFGVTQNAEFKPSLK